MGIILVGPRVGDSKSKKELTKKRKIIAFFQNTNFSGSYCPYNKLDNAQNVFKKYMLLYVVKSYQPPFSIENPWLKQLVLQQCKKV